MTVLHGTEIVHAVGQRECLRVGQRFADLLDCAVNIAKVGIDFGDDFTVDARAEVQYAVGRGVLRAEVDHIVVLSEYRGLFAVQRSVGVERVARCEIRDGFVAHGNLFIFLFGLVVLAEGEAHPILAQEDAAQIGVIHEDHAVEVVHFALVEIGNVPEVAGRGQHGLLAIGADGLDMHHFERFGIRQGVHCAESLFAPVGSGEVFEQTIALRLQFGQAVVELLGRHGFGLNLVDSRLGSRFGCRGTRCGASGCFGLRCGSGSSRFFGRFARGCSRLGGRSSSLRRRRSRCLRRGSGLRDVVLYARNGSGGNVLFVLFHQAFSS